MTYGLLNPPAGAAINTSNGIFSWRPLIAQSGASNLVNVFVFDNGTPSLSATQRFWVTVNRPARPGISAVQINQGQVRMTISGDAGPDYSMLASTNLVNWTLIQTTNSPLPPFLFVDPNSTNYLQRFYRVLLGP